MLLEREALLETLGERLAAAREGRGSLALVSGEAGAGKTSLIRVFVDSFDDSVLVVQGACDPLTTPRPLSPLYDFAADPDSGLGDLADKGLSPMEMFEMILDRLRNSIRPIVMVVEDIHWADDATLDFLRFIGRRVDSSQAVVIATYRDDEVGTDHPLRPVLGQLIPLPSTHRMVVPLLSEAAVVSLAAESPVDARELFRTTGGNPFFVTEVLATGAALPDTVQDAVLARVAGLGPETRRVVEAVSIAPRFLEIDKVTTLAGTGHESIDTAVGSGVLLSDGQTLRFRHELARAAIEESIGPGRTLQMHRQMIALLGEDETRDPARLTHHAVRSQNPELVIEFAPEAGDRAVAQGSRREAVEFYETALEHTSALGPGHTAALRVRLGSQLRLLDRPEESIEQLQLAIEHFRATGQTQELADALGILEGPLWNLRRFDEVWAANAEAIAVLEPLGPSEGLALAHYRASHSHMLARHAAPAFESIERTAAVADEVDSERARWVVGMMTGTIQIVIGDPAEGTRLLGESVASADLLGDHHLLSIALGMLGSGGGEARLYTTAIGALDRAIEQGLATDEDYGVAYDRSWLARIAFEQGRWDEAVALAQLVDRTTTQREGIAMITAQSALGRVRVRRGDPGGLAILDEMTLLSRAHELQHGWNAICGRAEHYWLAGDPGTGLDHLLSAYERALDTDSAWARGEIGFWMWRAGQIDGPPDGAARPFALQMAGDWRAAARAWNSIGCPYEEALALADGDVEANLEALATFDRLGAAPMSRRLRARLREWGVEGVPRGPTRATQANLAGLTDRQLEVLELMTLGLSNGEIANRLYISKKTVEHHVSAIFGKLGVETRERAIATASENAQVPI